MSNNKVKFTNICPVFLTDNVEKTVNFYVDILGFKYAKHFDKKDNFATIYKDSIEIIVLYKIKGKIVSNIEQYGNGYDAYINTNTLEGIDYLYNEYSNKGITIVSKPQLCDDGCYEFVFKDIDGRNIGIGLIKDKLKYFAKSNYLNV